MKAKQQQNQQKERIIQGIDQPRIQKVASDHIYYNVNAFYVQPKPEEQEISASGVFVSFKHNFPL